MYYHCCHLRDQRTVVHWAKFLREVQVDNSTRCAMLANNISAMNVMLRQEHLGTNACWAAFRRQTASSTLGHSFLRLIAEFYRQQRIDKYACNVQVLRVSFMTNWTWTSASWGRVDVVIWASTILYPEQVSPLRGWEGLKACHAGKNNRLRL